MGNCLFSGKKRVITRKHIHDGKEYISLIDNDYNDEVEELNEDSYHYPDNGNGHITNENENFININNLNLEELKESISNNQSEITNTNNIIQMKKVSRPAWLNWLYLLIFIVSSIQLFTFWSSKL